MSSIRFGGLASGLDTDSIVKELIKPYQMKVDSKKQEKTLLEWKQDAWKEMNKKLYDFHTKYVDKMRFGGTFNKMSISNSNTNALEVSSNSTLPVGTHTIDKIENLATGARITSGKLEFEGKAAGTGITLGKLGITAGEITIKDPINTEGTKITVSENMTIGELKDKLTKAMTGSTVSYDETFGTFFISTKSTGKSKEITISDNGETNILSKLGIAAETVKGGNAKFWYNGKEYNSETNKLTLNGMTINLKSITNEPTQLVSTQDTEAIYTWVKDFVTEYNKLIGELNEKIEEKPSKGMKPLTGEQRKAMGEDEIKLWEEKIKKSLFYKDEQIVDFTRIARRTLGDRYTKNSDGLDLTYKTLTDLGIVTGSYTEKGKLHIEGDPDDSIYNLKTNKLKEAIDKNPDDVISFITTVGKTLYDEYNTKLKSSTLKSAMNFYNDKVMADKMKEYDKSLVTLEERMYRMEDMYYKKFTAMEKMMSQMNNQGSWLSQQLGGQ